MKQQVTLKRRKTMKYLSAQRLLGASLFGLIVLLAACTAIVSSGTVPPTEATTPAAETEAEAAPSECPTATANEHLLVQVEAGYCLLYPALYTATQQVTGSVEIVSGTLMNHIDPRVSVTVEAANGLSVEDAAAQMLVAFSLPADGPGPQPITVGGVDAIMLDELPGQDLNRRVVLIHNGRLYTLFFAPIGDVETETRKRAEALYDMVINSFHLLGSDR